MPILAYLSKRMGRLVAVYIDFRLDSSHSRGLTHPHDEQDSVSGWSVCSLHTKIKYITVLHSRIIMTLLCSLFVSTTEITKT